MRLISRFSLAISRIFSALASSSVRLSDFVDSFVIAVLKPEEMMAEVKKAYRRYVPDYSGDSYIGQGLHPWEQAAIDKYAKRRGPFLVLGSGGGREAVALAGMGFTVTGIDSVEEMNSSARSNAERKNVKVDLRLGDWSALSLPGEKFDYCLLSCFMYGSIPSSRLRIRMLSAVAEVLGRGGIFIIHFFFDEKRGERLFKARRLLAMLTNGYVEYKTGDSLTAPHFFRFFSSDSEIIEEAAAAGFAVAEISACHEAGRYAVLQKS